MPLSTASTLTWCECLECLPPWDPYSAEPTLTAPMSPHRDFDSIDPQDPIQIHQMMLDKAEQELGIQPVLSSAEMAAMAESDRLGLITYLSQFYEAFKTSPGVRFLGGVYPILCPTEAGWMSPAC